MLEYIILMIVGLAVGLGTGLLIKGRVAAGKIRDAEQEAGRMLANAKREADTKLKEAQLESKDKLYQARSDFDRETRDKRTELQNQERKLTQKEESLEKKSDAVEKREAEAQRRERELTAREKIAQEKEEKYEAGLREQRQMLEKIASMTAEEAKRQLMVAMEDEAKYEAAKTIKRIEDEAREEADKKSKSIISTAIQRYASDYVAEATVSVVNLPNDEMKGRIIGREGRNIRALEAATGIDLIIDDTPEAVILSCYDPLRREIAKQTIERLIHDGRIHPARIEELADKVRKDLDISMKDEGEKAAFDLGIHNLHPEIIKLIGRLRYRTSYGQNVLMHSREVAYFAGIMAAELGVDQKLARRAGLLHDLGKAIDHEVEGTHPSIGGDLAKKYGESPKIINSILTHHGDGEAESVEAVLVAAADALSASRPGVRRETLESYLKRLEKLEEVANSFKGVEKSYAIQAGREIRIIVKPDDLSDALSAQVCRDVAKKIEQELSYPGQIKVTVVRESRYVEFAK
ncbi:MAG: ribonuclease Y [Nitrospirae bacterium GWC2_57_13]|jgi:ribonucrease Y|nr:MAG: ribonuclease Y [Nitrospirae bacterium GWC1_57_7]OGW26910.1 MAG: ribonuclease Y [Nitrospirae bacterium GWC2_57_13]OGW46447.1 MAG: ribonuclease Y [Nitrospirae bacterium GWD2_57_8]HAS54143.1 ribonuclease Y [Nitrospiraceae bacterium]